ncbi:UNVERIFIED_CONTAM: hypothetical protein K2H54_023714 [Gekko kuhli]
MLPAARADYLAPWWASWLHGLPHLSLSLHPVPSAFRPKDPDYQQNTVLQDLQNKAACQLALFQAARPPDQGINQASRAMATFKKIQVPEWFALAIEGPLDIF